MTGESMVSAAVNRLLNDKKKARVLILLKVFATAVATLILSARDTDVHTNIYHTYVLKVRGLLKKNNDNHSSPRPAGDR